VKLKNIYSTVFCSVQLSKLKFLAEKQQTVVLYAADSLHF
jgi:hypothetical protein